MFFVAVLSLSVVMFFPMSMGKVSFARGNSGDDDSRSNDDGSSDDNCCEGKVTELTLQYNGAVHALVEVVQKKNGDNVFTNTVSPGDQFTFSGTGKKGTLGSEISIFVDGVLNTKIHTSCSKPIGPGLVSGDFEVIEGYSRNGGPLCAVDVECAELNVEGDIAVNCEVVINSDGEWVGPGGSQGPTGPTGSQGPIGPQGPAGAVV
jgi:hypothetical protein